ncbi:MAG: YcaQ family DNA glycosylase [Caldilineae bacterium]|nr:YcaQ family DNA glycosylase [Chloroflexota bacterium]MCB9176734.1 YcaQ family DNA glycosylase [Caldilineae bacterium]
MPSLSLAEARRIALAAQGFGVPRPRGRVDRRHFRRVLETLGLVQLDTVNVMARAHYMPFFARLGAFDRDRLDAWLWHSGDTFEYWGHAISVLPVDAYPLLRHRMAGRGGWRRLERLQAERPGYVEQIRDEVLARGPLTMAELSDGGKRLEGWWRSEARVVLEHLFDTGQIAARRRPDFTRIYAAPRSLVDADALAAAALPQAEAQTQLLERAAASLGLATTRDLADYYRLPVADSQRRLEDLARAGRLERVTVAGWPGSAWLHPAARRPRRIASRALISPFDSLIWYRPRVERLWAFHYRIEIYVPASQRRFGYYVLPFLLNEALVARVDLKADRAEGRLRVRAAWIEPDQAADRVAPALVETLRETAAWLGLDGITVEPRGDLAAYLARSLGSGAAGSA